MVEHGHPRQPTDQWIQPLAALLGSPRSSKALRFAMAIGSVADHAMLAKFVDNPQYPVFRTHDAREIQKFFRWVTMSVTARSRSAVPNQTAPMPIEEIEDFSYPWNEKAGDTRENEARQRIVFMH